MDIEGPPGPCCAAKMRNTTTILRVLPNLPLPQRSRKLIAHPSVDGQRAGSATEERTFALPTKGRLVAIESQPAQEIDPPRSRGLPGPYLLAVRRRLRAKRRFAPPVYSMAASSDADVPRGLDFLFDRNRFNVAVSRARALPIVLCSGLLVESRARNLDDMRLLSLFCRYVELARVGHPEPSAAGALR